MGAALINVYLTGVLVSPASYTAILISLILPLVYNERRIHNPRLKLIEEEGMEPITLIIFSVLFVLLLKITGKSRKAKLVDELPGPPGVPLLGNALQFVGLPRHERMNEIMKRDKLYGPMYRNWIVTLPYIHICSAELAEKVLTLKNVKKGQIYKFLEPWLGRSLLTSDGNDWKIIRKLVTPTFHFQILESFIETFQKNSLKLVEKLGKEADTNFGVDVSPYLTLAALDSICETAMGTKVNAQDNETSKYVIAIKEILRLTFYRYDRFWLHSDWMWKRSEQGKEADKVLDILHGFVDGVIQERREERRSKLLNENDIEKKNANFLDLFLDECEKTENTDITDKKLRFEVNTFMFEGHDTTTTTLTHTLLFLGTYPELQEKLYEELLSVVGPDIEKEPTMSELSELKYMEHFVNETLRLYPPVPFISRTLLEDAQIGDYMIPKDSILFLSLSSMLRDPKYFPNPDKFDPDRFLPENTVGRYPFAFMPFSAGPRNCIGKRFAMVEVKVFLAAILRKYRLEAETKLETLKIVMEIVQKSIDPITIRLYSRPPLQ